MMMDKKIEDKKTYSDLLSNGIAHAYYSSGAFREVGILEFALEYIKHYNECREVVENYEEQKEKSNKVL